MGNSERWPHSAQRRIARTDPIAIRLASFALKHGLDRRASARPLLDVLFRPSCDLAHFEAEWYRRAAEQGDASSQYNLAVMYDDGKGVPRDYIQAHKWYNLAASRFQAPDQRQMAVSHRDRVALRLSPALLAHAQRLAREWRPKNEEGAPSPDAHTESVTDFAPTELEKAATGSGFFVSGDGHILTNAHVVSECTEVRIPQASHTRVVGYDDAADLALLQSSSRSDRAVAAFRQGRGIRSGASVVVVGYPLHGIVMAEKTDESTLARELRVLAAVKLYELGRLSSGRVAELAGIARVEFLLTLDRYNVFPLETELCDLERERA